MSQLDLPQVEVTTDSSNETARLETNATLLRCLELTDAEGELLPSGSDCWRMALTCVRMSVMYAVVLLLNAGIVVYENVVADTYRTLVNKAVAVMAAYNVLLMTW